MPTLTERITSSPQGMRIWQQERLVFEVTERICELLAEKGISRAKLASALGKGPSHVTQLLNGDANMTLHTVADLFWACGRAAHITDEPLEKSAGRQVFFYMDIDWHNPQQSPAINTPSRLFDDSSLSWASQGTAISTCVTTTG